MGPMRCRLSESARLLHIAGAVACFLLVMPLSAVELLSAITRDFNGDSRLEGIEITLADSVTFPEGYHLDSIIVRYDTVQFRVDSIVPSPGNNDRHFILHLGATPDLSWPQSAWTPKLTIGGVEELEGIEDVVCSDGAGPVIWEAKRISDCCGTGDSVIITFSEKITGPDGKPLDLATAPGDFIEVATFDGKDTITSDTLLDGIDSLCRVTQDWLIFGEGSSSGLTGRNFVSLKADCGLIFDLSGNALPQIQKKVRVIVSGSCYLCTCSDIPDSYDIDTVKTVGSHYQHTLVYRNLEEAYDWQKNEGGKAFCIDFTLPSDSTLPMPCTLMVTGSSGVSVYIRTNEDVIPISWRDFWPPGQTRFLIFYWNGMIDSTTPADKGRYSANISMSYGQFKANKAYTFYLDSDNFNDVTQLKESNGSCGGCGTGTLLSLLVPLFYCVGRHNQKFFKA